MGVPTFCPIHLKIHECSKNINKAISRATENKIKVKMNRMLNPATTSNEPIKPAVVEKGTIQYILENAKKNNENIKHKLGFTNEDEKAIGVDENNIKAKMARLRAAVTNQQEVGERDNNNLSSLTRTSKVEPTIILTATEIEALIEKAVVKAISKEKNNKKKRGK
ncbi:hypothetical protein SKUN_00785 [Spiroplasma kunkelii CR2-3x]|uniref:Uncharacterized protein n=1 Tax=Spiroplasma kunkelii CR2-3x TaxID=273035 RepID=A0A0K2JGF4_SPIKU|nr:hypothetical protein [Spiroplasma kunkelii]ALA97675.1 hypothetical protein SKUN_00785 [Spiroplasma kunkelii CR2-3x]